MSTTLEQRPFSKKIGFDAAYLAEFEAKVFIEGAQTHRRLTNFFTLLLLSTVIATYGVLSNSTATVIGAMIVAPLMGPIIATTAAVVMGSVQRALRSLALVVAGVACVILFSILLTMVVPNSTISFTQNGELASRIAPGIYALLTALGAGAAGAFIYSRAEISDSMGGVAIAISLVPPLCVVGVSISNGNWPAAGGAMLLFLTNFLAILLAGGLVFILLGLGRVATTERQAKIRQRAFAMIVICTIIIAVPLSLNAYQTVITTISTNKAAKVVETWLEGTNDQIVAVNVNGENIAVSVEGTGELKSMDALAADLEKALGQRVVVKLRVIPTKIEVIQSRSSP